MGNFHLNASLLKDLKSVKSELSKALNDICDRDTTHGRLTARNRMECVSGFRPIEFRQLQSLDEKWARRRAIAILRFLEARSGLNESARRGLNTIELNGQLNRLRASENWVRVRIELSIALGLSERAKPTRKARSSPTRKSPTVGTQVLAPAEEGIGWRLINVTEFEAPSDAGALPADYIGGRARVPWWVATEYAVQRHNPVASLDNLLKNSPIVILHGPTGQGKSTLLRQYARHWLNRGCVFEIFHPSALSDRALAAAVAEATGQVLLVADDMDGEMATIGMELQNKLRINKASIVISSQSRARFGYLAKLPRGTAREYAVPNPNESERLEMVDRILAAQEITDETKAAHVRSLFSDALDKYPNGGLWPAMYQATHGEGLTERMWRLVQDIAADASRLNALAAVVFANALRDETPDEPALTYSGLNVDYKLGAAILNHLNLAPDQCRRATSALKAMHTWFDREVIGDELDRASINPPLDLRHPAVSKVLFDCLFKNGGEAGVPHFAQWNFYVPVAAAFADPAVARPAADVVRLMYSLDRAVRGRTTGGASVAGLLAHRPYHHIEKFGILSDYAETVASDNPMDHLCALIWKAAAIVKKNRSNYGEAYTILERVLSKRDSHSALILLNIGRILQYVGKPINDPRDNIQRDGLYYLSKLIHF